MRCRNDIYWSKKESQLSIVSCPLEKKENWLKAIQEDKLTWSYHISELTRFESKIAEDYGVREIPTKYLINPEGTIIGVNMSFDNMRDLLK